MRSGNCNTIGYSGDAAPSISSHWRYHPAVSGPALENTTGNRIPVTRDLPSGLVCRLCESLGEGMERLSAAKPDGPGSLASGAGGP
jgi:hypothetical protein